ncbi:MAG: hypothetical protein L0206_15570, partial [Actinobacteria bacterium]|nr:hypothetical protein [Actinomycetota bacterium]
FVADGSAGLRVVDVSDPGRPTEIGFLDTPGSASGIEVLADLVYLADGASGVRIVDVSDPTAPVELGAFDTPGSALDVEVSGSLALVADGSGGFRVLDVSNPAAPFQLGQHTTQTVYDVEVVGTRAHAATGNLRVYEFANPAFPFVARAWNNSSGTGVAASGAIAYLAGVPDVIDTAPAPAVQIASLSSNIGAAFDVELAGTLAYVARNNGVSWYDVTNPAAPVLVDEFFLAFLNFVDVAVADPYIYGVGSNELRILGEYPCDDGEDNDGDGYVDFPDDPGCQFATSLIEDPQCQDGIDNDGKLGTDFDGGESVLGVGNGDPDGADPQCAAACPTCMDRPWKDKEAGGSGCGLGFEAAILLAPLLWHRRRARS